jgi:thymidylate synthase (FAD)
MSQYSNSDYASDFDEEPQTPIDSYMASYLGRPRGGVVKDVAFNRKSFGEGQPENPDQGKIHVGVDGIEVTLEQDFDDKALQHFFSFAINATRGIDPRNPPEPVDWEEMMRGGLQTALKRINIAFAVFGASRTATHQLVRSTRANFHQQSQRAHYYGDRPSVRMPESFLGKYAPNPMYGAADHEPASLDIAEEFESLVDHAAAFYRMATAADISYQDARFGLLEGTTNFILCEYSLDEFIAVYAYRACSMFQWEIVQIVRKMREVLIAAHPWLEPYIKISCERTRGALDHGLADPEDRGINDALAHTCTYQGWESVEGQCDFPWARESNRTFRSDRHQIVKKKVQA